MELSLSLGTSCCPGSPDTRLSPSAALALTSGGLAACLLEVR